MNLQHQDRTLLISGVVELNATNAGTFRDAARTALKPETIMVTVDLAAARFLDSSGLGALVTLHKTMQARGGKLQILNPSSAARQVLEMTQLHRAFDIIPR